MTPQSARRLSALSVRIGSGALVLAGLGLVLVGLLLEGLLHAGVAAVAAAAVGLVLGAAGGTSWWLSHRDVRAGAAVLSLVGLGVAIAGWAVVASLGVVVSAPLVLGGLLVGGIGFGAVLGSAR